MLNRSQKSGYPCLVPDLRQKAFNLSPRSMMLAMDLSFMAFICWDTFPLCLICWVFITDGCWILSYAFSVCWDDHVIVFRNNLSCIAFLVITTLLSRIPYWYFCIRWDLRLFLKIFQLIDFMNSTHFLLIVCFGFFFLSHSWHTLHFHSLKAEK